MLENERLIRLEEQCYFQEQAIAALNEALVAQQHSITRLEKSLQQAEEHLDALHYILEEKGVQTLPPHHMPERY